MRLPRIPSRIANGVLVLAAAFLFAQGFACWAVILGMEGGGGLMALPPGQRTVLVVLAVLSPVAGVGAWFRAQWGPVLWALSIAAIVLTAALGISARIAPRLLLAHLVLLALWAVTAALADRRRAAGVTDD